MSYTPDEYSRKRNFDKTPEPGWNRGPAAAFADEGGPGLRFVVQHHLARRDHYDLRLEWDGALLSWAVPKGPSFDPRDKRLAVRVEDHPPEYRNFEGTIPKGEYGGGVVMIWDEGFWEPLGNAGEALAAGSLKFVLKGRRLRGKWALVRLKQKAGEKADNWLLLKERDDAARDGDGISGFDTSVRTGRTLKEIEEGLGEKFVRNPFSHTAVQLAKPVRRAPEGDEWLYEVKYDGYRILAYAEAGSVRLVTRNGIDYTHKFQEAADAIAAWAGGRAMVLDGEMAVADDHGRTDFTALQSYMKNHKGRKPTYIVFDLLALDGADLRGRPLIERKEALETLMHSAPKNLHYSAHVRGNGEAGFRAACEANMEGIVGKKAGSVYSGTRNGDWIKLKCDTRQEFVIGGYTLTEKKGSGVSALLLGAYDGGELHYVGRAGTGFTQRDIKELEEKFKGIARATPPFKQAPKPRFNEKITWLEPLLAAEIKFAEWTGARQLRQASFKGLRTDKNPRDIRLKTAERETPPDEKRRGGHFPAAELEKPMKTADDSLTIGGIKITSPRKVLFEDPPITKADVVRYYEAVSERMMPYVERRLLSIVRCPKGVSQSCFYKKHPGPDNRNIVAFTVLSSSGTTEEYFYIENADGLLYEAQMGTLEFHTWGSRVEALEKPDIMVFDLDPDAGMYPSQVRRGVRDLKSILEQLSLVSFLKTSGGKGYHVAVPLQPSAGWDAFHDFARRVAEVMEKQWPDRYTANVRKDKRRNKIFIDWIRNGRGATSIAPYSLRARQGARVSMPIFWEELDEAAPDGFSMADAIKRAGGDDPWKDFFKTGQRLK